MVTFGSGGEVAGSRSGLLAATLIAALCLFSGALPAASAAATTPAVAWALRAVAQPTSFSAADDSGCEAENRCDRYTVLLTDLGTRPSSGTIVVVDTLPFGIATSGAPGGENELMKWGCGTAEVAGHETVTCTSASSVPALTAAAPIEMPVVVSPSATGTLTNRVEASGGGAASVAWDTPTALGAPALPFGLLEEGFGASAVNAAGEQDTIAGDHPGAQFTSLTFPSATSFSEFGRYPYPVQEVKQIVIDLPPGLTGDALAASACSLADITDLTAAGTPCPAGSRVGRGALIEADSAETELSIFNAVPERGYPAELALYIPSFQHAVLLYGTIVGSGAATHLRLTSAPLTSAISIVSASFTLFGDPTAIDGSGPAQPAFLTNPSDCVAASFATTIHVDSWQDPGRVEPNGQPDLSDPNWRQAVSKSPPVTGCSALQFHPRLSVTPSTTRPDSPSGFVAEVKIPQNEDPNGLSTPPLKTASVTLPTGVSISPAVADGLTGCAETGAEGIEPQSPDPGHCPAAAALGSVEVATPLLGEPLRGSLFLAQPGCGDAGHAVAGVGGRETESPCGEGDAETGGLFALYLEAGSQASGVHLKLKGKVEVGADGARNDLAPGQVRLSFAEVPQLPLSELTLSFTNGPRALLATPQSCGTFTVTSELEAWSHLATGEAQGTPNLSPEPSFPIAGCESRFSPTFTAGTDDPVAGAYSPFTLTLGRDDGEQDLSSFALTLPPGLLANLASVIPCAEPQAAQGACAQVARLGTATVAVGAGADPLYLGGSIYLTGPYGGQPFGLSIVVPAEIGPFHLGNVVIRASIAVDPATGALTIATARGVGGIPSIIDGIPLRIRTVNVTLDRAGFVSNPTSCGPLAIAGTISSTQGASAPVSSSFQDADCANLKFAPRLTASTRANGELSGHGASLHLAMTTGTSISGSSSISDSGSPSTPGSSATTQANLRSLKLDLPQRLPARLQAIQKACPESTFDANAAACPPAATVGTAAVQTPILGTTMEGPAILVAKTDSGRVHPGESKLEREEAAFPNLVLVLQGQGVRIDLTGGVFVNEKNITSVTFRTVPDLPIRLLDLILPEGKTSILAASSGLCTKKPLRITTAITGQNGARLKPTVKVAVSGCKKPKKRHHSNKGHR